MNTTSNQEPFTGLLDVIYMNEIQHPTKSLLQDYWMSYMNKIQHPTKSLLQDYWMSYMNDFQDY